MLFSRGESRSHTESVFLNAEIHGVTRRAWKPLKPLKPWRAWKPQKPQKPQKPRRTRKTRKLRMFRIIRIIWMPLNLRLRVK